MNNEAQICPVCNGCGKYTPYNDYKTTLCPVETVCHGCSGKGWITVEQQETSNKRETITASPYYIPIDISKNTGG